MARPYAGRIQAVVFDWAGTIVDHGSRAPMGVFVEVFKRFGVEISVAEARAPMGLPKWQHIQAVGLQPAVAARWQATHGRAFADADVDRIYDVFTPLNAEVVPQFADIIPGALETVAALRAAGLKIGSTTGYNRPIMDVLAPIAAKAGYVPDNLVCAGDLVEGRPSPLMMYRCFTDLGIGAPASVVKVDDTVPGIDEGLNAGTWTVGLAVSGNGFGLSAAETAALAPAERAERRAVAARELTLAGAHYVIDSVADLLPVLDAINGRLARGEQP
jgi:phosphonoacetaldehyde hydrolase